MDMNNEKMMSKARAVAEGAIAVAILLAVLTIGGELYAPLKDTLKAVFTHHWLGKCALSIALFVLVYLIRFRTPTNSDQLYRAVRLAAWFSLFSALAITMYFTAHTFHWF